MYWLYDLALAPAAAVVSPALRLPRFHDERERLALYPAATIRALEGERVVWLHNASVGETLAASVLLEPLRERLPGRRIVASTTTRSGRAIAASLAGVDAAVLAPLDSTGAVERALDAIHPEAFVFTETEIWPNLLRGLSRRRIPALLVSGRISARSFARYRLVRPFLGRVLGQIAFFGMQTESDAERIVALGAPHDRVEVTGSLKYGGERPPSRVPIAEGPPIWVAGSTRPGEEAICLEAFRRVRERVPDARLVLAPRHLERLGDVAAAIESQGFTFVRRTTLDGPWGARPDAPPVLLLDTLGELGGLYAHATVAFVGGTLAPIGGHNLAEPARFGVPVLHGPHVENVREVAERLDASGGGERVDDASSLAEAVARIFADGAAAAERGRAAAVATRRAEVVGGTIAAVDRWLPRR